MLKYRLSRDSRKFLLMVFCGIILTIIGLYGILGKFLMSNDSLYIYTDNVWSLYGDLSGQNSFSTIDFLHGGFNQYLRLIPYGIVHLFLYSILNCLRISFTGIVIEKIFFTALIFLNVNCMLFVSYFFLKKHYSFESSLAGSIFASFLFTFNPTAIMYIKWPIHWMAYVLLPIILYLSHKIITNNELKYAVLLGLLIAFVGVEPHWLFFYSFLISIYTLLNLKASRKFIRRLLCLFSVAILVFLGISSYFVLPSLSYSLAQGLLSPIYVVTLEFVREYSKHADIINTIRFMGKAGYQPGEWDIVAGEGPPSSAFFPFWLVGTFSIPFITFLGIILNKRQRVVLFCSTVFILSIVLACGTKVLGVVYYALVNLPFGWIFRVPTKWLWISVFSSCILSGFFISAVYTFLSKYRRMVIPVFLGIIILVSLPSWQLFTGNASGITEPVCPPIKDIDVVDRYLKDQNSTYKVFWLPFTRYHLWNQKVLLGDFYTVSSHMRAIDPTPVGSGIDAQGNNFLRFNLYNALLNNRMQEAADYLRIIGVKYIVWHDDYSSLSPLDTPKEQLDRIFTNIAHSNVFEEKMTVGYIHLFEIKDVSNFYISDKTILVHGGLEKMFSLKMFAPSTFSYVFADQVILESKNLMDSIPIYVNPNMLDILLSYSEKRTILNPFLETDYETPAELWSKGSVLDLWGAFWHIYLRARGITNWQFDYGKGLIFTWANTIVEEPRSYKLEDLITKYNFENNEIEGWHSSANVYNISIEEYNGGKCLNAALYKATSKWKIIRSPLVPVRYGEQYKWEFFIKGMNTYKASIWITEYDENGEWINSYFMKEIAYGDFDWKKISVNFSPTSKDTACMVLDIVPLYNHDDSIRSLPNEIWIDNVKVYNLRHCLLPNRLEISFKVEDTDSYDLFVRYFQSIDGGQISMYLDGNLLQIISTSDQISGFVWDNIGILNLNEGEHKLAVENDEGFNAINIFMLIQHSETVRLDKEIERLLNNKKVIYILEAESDMYYLTAENSNKYGEEASNGEVLELTTTSKVLSNFEIVKSGYYRVAIRKKGGDCLVDIDGKDFSVNSSRLNWVYINSIYLDKGFHRMTVTSNQSLDLDIIWIWSIEEENETIKDLFKSSQYPAILIHDQMLDLTKYVVRVNATHPFMLSFAETYDPQWVAYVNGEKIQSLPLYSIINGFWINQTGLLEIIIEYEPQKWFYYGSMISVTTLITCAIYLTYCFTRNKAILKWIKKWLKLE